MNYKTTLRIIATGLLFGFSITNASAQVVQKIGQNSFTINPNAVLELESDSKGFLPPRMATPPSGLSDTDKGLIVYVTGGANPGLQIWTGTKWIAFVDTEALDKAQANVLETAAADATLKADTAEAAAIAAAAIDATTKADAAQAAAATDAKDKADAAQAAATDAAAIDATTKADAAQAAAIAAAATDAKDKADAAQAAATDAAAIDATTKANAAQAAAIAAAATDAKDKADAAQAAAIAAADTDAKDKADAAQAAATDAAAIDAKTKADAAQLAATDAAAIDAKTKADAAQAAAAIDATNKANTAEANAIAAAAADAAAQILVEKKRATAAEEALNASKENTANKSETIDINAPSHEQFPTVTAVINYVARSINSVRTITSSTNITVVLSDYSLLCNTSSGAFTLSLPAADNDNIGKIYVIRKTDPSNNVLTFSPGLVLDEGIVITELNYPKTIKVQSDGSNWFIIN
jgi:hypothetical protein